MNRRIVVPLLFTVFMLCFALIALPVQGAGKSQTTFGVQQDATEEADACEATFEVPGTVLTDIFMLDVPGREGLPLIKLIRTDVIEVLGKNSTGFWIAARSNTGIVGWVDSTQVQVDRKLWSDPDVVPVVEELPESDVATDEDTDEEGDTDEDDEEDTDEEGDDEGDDEGDEGDDEGEGEDDEQTNRFEGCITLEAIVTADRFALQIKPLTRSGDAGETVTRGQKVLLIALNPSGSWAWVRTEGGTEGWITTSYTRPTLGVARMGRLPKDFTVTEATLTPVP